MNLHEYQAKQLLAKYGIKTPRGAVAGEPKQAAEIFNKLNLSKAVAKAQVHSGGRGKAGGIKVINSAAEAAKATGELIGQTLITHQSGPAGKPIHKVLIEETLPIEKELYASIVIDRKHNCPVLMASTEGGMEIEELAAKSPEKIIKLHLHPYLGLQPYQARELVYALASSIEQNTLRSTLYADGAKLFVGLSKLFAENDCSLAEINPLIISKDGLIALDGKINLDDRGLFRHKDLLEMRDISQEHPQEYEASKHDLSYIGLDGNIGCMVNGAGLAMATMDLIKLHGGEPANFLDVGGGASKEQVANAFKLLISNKNVEAILVNIFGGIMKCDVIAEGITAAVKETGLNLPLVVRLEGTNVKIGKEILNKSGLNIVSADTMDGAAIKVVKCSQR
ncbi:MAG: ADP-forming succinate--CoA ligase subunit beta [Planctomycetes bacterium]|nr:ADP-forming succinate--CoA ligase subunit beta [Planctomycetota bacterium]